jgi:hypothetical protein
LKFMDDPVLLCVPDKKTETTLLPKVLLSPAAFLWLWVLPMGILGLLNLQGYWLVAGNLDPQQRSNALLFGLCGGANLLLGLLLFGLGVRQCRKAGTKQLEPFLWGLPAIAAQVAYLWLAVSLVDGILPRSVTAWIYPSDRFLFNQFAFAMLPLFTGILRIAGARTAFRPGRAMAFNLGFAIAAPVLLYLWFAVIRLFRAAAQIEGVVFATVVIVLGVLMFVAIIRALLLALRRTERWQEKGERGAIVLFALILPVGGLLLNRDIPFPVDFQAWEVYALVAANTGILLLASFQHARHPRLSFCLLCATFPFSLYFFIVFLPYTPLSILALVALGVGFLVLCPTFLFTLHLHLLHKARRNPSLGSDRIRVTLAGLACCLILPAYFSVRGLADKTALNAALDYVYAPIVQFGSNRYPANLANLRRALDSHRSYKNGVYYPLLSDYYSWLVFDNLVLPDDKLARVEQTFFGTVGSKIDHDPVRNRGSFWGGGGVRRQASMPRARPVPDSVEVSRLNVRTNEAGDRQTVVTLALTLENNGLTPAEYLKALPLPAGVFVQGFRLQIDGHLVPGRIFEKKTALWVYTMIRDSERRDPGLLCYDSSDTLQLRVFPVNQSQPVTVEIDFLVPAVLTSENLGDSSSDAAVMLARVGALLVPQLTSDNRGNAFAMGIATPALPGVDREPYLHVIIDRSKDNGYTGDLAAILRVLQKKFPFISHTRITLANYDVVDLVPRLTALAELLHEPEINLDRVMPLSGGLDADLALAHAIRLHRDLDLDRPPASGRIPPRPIFVILSGNAGARPLELKLTEAWADLLPDLAIHEMRADGTQIGQRPWYGSPALPLLRVGTSVRPLLANGAARFKSESANAVLEYWSPESSEWRLVPNVVRDAGSSLWARAVALRLLQQDFDRSPGDAAVDLRLLVKASREYGLLVGATSYIAVENTAQWNMLDLSERKKLDQNAALDFLEAPAPPVLYVVFGFGIWLGFRCWRRSCRARLAKAV